MSDEIGKMNSALEPELTGTPDPSRDLFLHVYKELRRIAARYMQREGPGQTIQATDLVHEAYMRLGGREGGDWRGQTHFVAAAAISMRRILVDRARKKLADKHGGGGQRVPLDDAIVASPDTPEDIVALDEAMKRLKSVSPRQCRIVELRFFAGLEIDEIAKLENVSSRTIKRDWNFARAWLHREIARGD